MINNKITNLPSSTKVKKNFEMSFIIFEASLTFIELKKTFIQALIVYHFDSKSHI